MTRLDRWHQTRDAVLGHLLAQPGHTLESAIAHAEHAASEVHGSRAACAELDDKQPEPGPAAIDACAYHLQSIFIWIREHS